jgi:transcriptional regulator with XRE-family HTH domain
MISGTKIKAERVRLKLTQVQLANQIGRTSTCVSRYECGRATPSTSTLRELARVFGLSMDALLEQRAA